MLAPHRIALVGWHAFRLFLDPTRLQSVFGIVDAIDTPELHAEMQAQLQAHPQTALALREQRRLRIDVDALAALPEGTLGRTFADFVRANGIEPAVLTNQGLQRSYWPSVHMYETHDVWHVLTGIGTDPVSELELLSFVLAQHSWERLAPIALAVGFLKAAFGHRDFTPVAVQEAVVRGWMQGRRAALLFGIDWSTQWHRPLEAVREELGLGRQELAAAA